MNVGATAQPVGRVVVEDDVGVGGRVVVLVLDDAVVVVVGGRVVDVLVVVVVVGSVVVVVVHPGIVAWVQPASGSQRSVVHGF